MKAAAFFFLATGCGFVALYYFGMLFQSVDYHDGRYHPIPRTHYAITFAAATIATISCWKLGRRSSRPQ